jgi:hypothetical protein
MEICIRKSQSDSQATGTLPESCNSLLAVSADRTGPVLHRRDELPDAPGYSSSSSSLFPSDAVAATPAPSTSADDHCDPCNIKSTGEQAKSAESAKNSKPSLIHHFWFNAGMLSYHPSDHDHQFNDFNYGAGVEFDKSKTWAFAAGEYRNSVRHNSYYGMVEFKPLHVGPLAAGIAGGTINGYPDMNKGNFFPAAMPVASIEEKHVGANFIYIPNVVKGVVPALSLQLKFRF